MSENAPERPLRFLRLPDILAMTGLSRSTIYNLQSRGLFPMRVKLTENFRVGGG